MRANLAIVTENGSKTELLPKQNKNSCREIMIIKQPILYLSKYDMCVIIGNAVWKCKWVLKLNKARMRYKE